MTERKRRRGEKREEKVKRVRFPVKRRAEKVAKKSSKFQGFRRLPEISLTV
jgi:hypothetical protein